MRIHHVIASALAKYGGPGVFVMSLCRELAALRHEVTLHTLGPAPEDYSAETSGFLVRNYQPTRRRWRFGVSADMAAGLRSAAHGGDVMHVHGLWMLPNILPAWAVRGSACKLVFSAHGMLDAWALERNAWQKRAVWLAGQGQAIRAADLLHATADSEHAALRQRGLRAPVAVIPIGVELPADSEIAHFSASPRTLLVLSRLDPKKGIDRLIRAWVTLQAQFPQWQLRIVGPDFDGHGEALRRLAGELEARRVHFCGPAFGAAKRNEFQNAQLFILPTHSENFGIGVAEALAFGLPAIVAHGAPWQGLERQHCGYWIDNRPESIAACLRAALALSPAELAALGARGRAWMQRDFAWPTCAASTLAAYAWLKNGGPMPSSIERLG